MISTSPFPILGRGHSGGRLVCEAFIHNGIDMGQVSDPRRDTYFFGLRTPQVRHLVTHAYDYLNANQAEKSIYQTLLRNLVQTYYQREINPAQPFGWKMGVSLFLMPIVLDALPKAKVIHLIRDGRDVMLSRLHARIAHLDDPVNRLTVFGREDITEFEGLPLTTQTIDHYRNAIEMQHWVTAVSFGLEGRRSPEQYLEVYYEKICASPLAEFERIFNFLELPFRTKCQHWLKENVYQHRVQKWQSLSAEEMVLPLKIGGDLLANLGYMNSRD